MCPYKLACALVGARTGRCLVVVLASAALIILLTVSGGARGSPAAPSNPLALPTDPLLAKFIEQTFAARPELARARAEAKAERARVSQVGALPDPMLQLGVQNDGFTSWEVGKMGTSFYSIMASQTFPWPGKLRLSSEVAQLRASQAKQNVARVRLSTEADVRRAYLNLILARDRLVLLDRLEAIWKKSAVIARTRYEAGQGAQSDVLRAQLEFNRIRQRRWAMEADVATEVQALNRLRGRPLDERLVTSVHLAELPLPVLVDSAKAEQLAIERSPEIAGAHLTVTQAERSVFLAHKSYFPDFTVNAGVMPRGGAFPPMWLVSVGIPLPLFAGSKQRQVVAEAASRALATTTNVESLAQILRLRVKQRRTALRAMLKIIRLYQDGLLIQSKATTESTLAQYEVGKVTFASVLESNAGFIADEDGYLQALAQAHRLQIEAAEVSLGPVAPTGTAAGSAAIPGAGAAGGGGFPPGSGMAAPSASGGNAPSM